MLRVSVLELPARWGEPLAALEEVERLLARGPTDVAVVPELSFTGYVSPDGAFDPTRFAESTNGPTVRAVARMAARHAVHLVMPLVLAEGDAVFNAAVIVGPDGGALATYRKRHPWVPEAWATPGQHPMPVVRIGPLKVTTAICYDAHFLDDDSADALREADLLLFTSAWVDDEDSRVPLLRSLARRFEISIANANWAPGVVRLPGQGGSCILDARGDIVAVVDSSGGGRADAVIHPRASTRRRPRR